MGTDVVRRWKVADLVADMRPPTDDDVSFDLDGNPLDSPAKVLEHLERLSRGRIAAERHVG